MTLGEFCDLSVSFLEQEFANDSRKDRIVATLRSAAHNISVATPPLLPFYQESIFVTFMGMLSHIKLFATLWALAHQAPLPVGLSRQEWVAMLSSRASSQPRNRTCITHVSYITGEFFTISAIRKAPCDF